jgi:putative phosphoribosyl transferase
MTDFALPYRDRAHAGHLLASALASYRGRPGLLVLALPRGGVAVAREVARELQAPLDIVVVRKLGYPGHEEYAMGAIASGGVRVMRDRLPGIAPEPQALAAVLAREEAELLRREQLYRQQRPAPGIAGRSIIVVDDGLATGATMQAAVLAIRQQQPQDLVVAVPVGSAQGCRALEDQGTEVVCPARLEHFAAVSLCYLDFPQATDEEVRRLLDDAHRETAQQAGRPQ